jgi:hypothetical protein
MALSVDVEPVVVARRFSTDEHAQRHGRRRPWPPVALVVVATPAPGAPVPATTAGKPMDHQVTISGWSTSEASLGPPRSEPPSSAAAAAIGHQGMFTQGPAACQTDRRRPLRRGPIGFPTGWPLRKWLVRQGVC